MASNEEEVKELKESITVNKLLIYKRSINTQLKKVYQVQEVSDNLIK